jgi:hypothetical protein
MSLLTVFLLSTGVASAKKLEIPKKNCQPRIVMPALVAVMDPKACLLAASIRDLQLTIDLQIVETGCKGLSRREREAETDDFQKKMKECIRIVESHEPKK